MSEISNLTREQLYEEVWSTSMRQLATKYNLSDRGIAKICKLRHIPYPGLGYWAKVEAGQSPTKPPLPPLSGEPDYEMATIGEKADLWHPLVVQTKHATDELTSPKSWVKFKPKVPHLEIHTDGEDFPRALALMNRVLLGLTTNGAEISIVGTYDEFKTVIKYNGEAVSLSVDYAPFRDRVDVLSRLQFSIAGDFRKLKEEIYGLSYFSRPAPGKLPTTVWSDLKHQRLETSIGLVVEGIISALASLNVMRHEKDQIEKKRERERVAAEKAERIFNEKRNRLKKIEAQALCYRRAVSIRAYLDRVEAEYNQGNLQPQSKADFDNWLAENRQLADELDPICGGWRDQPPEFSQEGHRYYSAPTKKVPVWVYLRK